MKENDGKASKKMLRNRIIYTLSLMLLVIMSVKLLLETYEEAKIIENYNYIELSQKQPIIVEKNIQTKRQKNQKEKKKNGGGAGKDRKQSKHLSKSGGIIKTPEISDIIQILNGEFTLVDIFVKKMEKNDENKSAIYNEMFDFFKSQTQFNFDDHSDYSATGVFCELDWSLQKERVAEVSMFRFLRDKSSSCNNRLIHFELSEVANLMKVMDLVNEDDSSVVNRPSTAPFNQLLIKSGSFSVKSMKPTGFVFHESRCGSTLVANSLSAFAPAKTRVYSESPPPINALRACDSFGSSVHSNCDPTKLIQDTLYIMGRTNAHREKYLFFKMQSISTKYISKLRKAYGEVPWIFVHRDPVQVMMSHIRVPELRKANCMRTFNARPPDTIKLIQERKDQGGTFTQLEYCAAHLATLCEYAYKESSSSNTGKMVDYASLPDSLIDDIIPHYFLPHVSPGEFGPEEIQNILNVNKIYSKSGQQKKDWIPDSDKKEKEASEDLKAAAATILLPTYNKLAALKNT